jgi:hypothetical protein
MSDQVGDRQMTAGGQPTPDQNTLSSSAQDSCDPHRLRWGCGCGCECQREPVSPRDARWRRRCHGTPATWTFVACLTSNGWRERHHENSPSLRACLSRLAARYSSSSRALTSSSSICWSRRRPTCWRNWDTSSDIAGQHATAWSLVCVLRPLLRPLLVSGCKLTACSCVFFPSSFSL